MKKILIVGINSQYVHTNLAIRYLKSYIEKYSELRLEIYESTINNQLPSIFKDIFEKNPEKVIFSTYIWNKEYVFKLIREIKKILPHTQIILGGPEVSYDSLNIMKDMEEIDCIVSGEGERSLLNLLTKELQEVNGVYYRNNGEIEFNGNETVIENLDEIPFPYKEEDLKDSNNKILYYESTRGCPYACSYCISSLDKSVRYYSTERVKSDLDKFIKSDLKLVKFVDRTFNLNKERYMEIWRFLLANYREGITFHFEISGDLFDDEAIAFLKNIPEGYFQFEIGVQTINPKTMESIRRESNLEKLADNVNRIKDNIHLHLDLIAGLPYEDYNSFKDSFNYVYHLMPEMIQLGFLKILKGTQIYRDVEKYNYKYTEFPAYEVLSNDFISYGGLSKLKKIETVLDYYYNSEKFCKSVEYVLERHYQTPFEFYEELTEYYDKMDYFSVAHKTKSLFDHFYEFFKEKEFPELETFSEYLKFDYISIGKPGNYPYWITSFKDKEKYNELLKNMSFRSIREGHNRTEIEKFRYNILENRSGKVDILFVYNGSKTKVQEC